MINYERIAELIDIEKETIRLLEDNGAFDKKLLRKGEN